MLPAKIEKKRLSGHGIEISFFPIDLKFKGNFLCTSVIMICLNSAIVLTGNSSSSRWLYFCTVCLCRAKPFEFLNSLPQVEQVEQAEQRQSLDRGVIGGVSRDVNGPVRTIRTVVRSKTGPRTGPDQT